MVSRAWIWMPVACVAAASAAGAQTPAADPAAVTPDDLRTPLAPAFALLDAAPTSVDRPQSARALTMNLFSAFRQGNGLPRHYALDVTPYWLRSHPRLTFDDYYRATVPQTLVRTFAVSVASASLDATDTAPARTSLGLGIRALLLAGQPHPSLQAARDQLMAITMEQASLDDKAVRLEFLIKQARAAGREAEAQTLEAARRVLESQTEGPRAELAARARAVNLRIQALDKDRVGWMVSLATAQVIDFPDDRFQDREIARWGFWVTPAYRVLVCTAGESGECQSTVDLIAVGRYVADRRGDLHDSAWDVGGRLLWQPTKEFAVSAELLRRGGTDATGGEGSNRSVGVLEYRLRDDIVLFGSFGRDFEPPEGGRTLVSLLGLHFGFGRKPVIDLSATKPVR